MLISGSASLCADIDWGKIERLRNNYHNCLSFARERGLPDRYCWHQEMAYKEAEQKATWHQEMAYKEAEQKATDEIIETIFSDDITHSTNVMRSILI